MFFFLFGMGVFISTSAQEAKRQSRFLVCSQYAGSIGFVSIGAGFTNKRQSLQYEGMYGHVPQKYGGPTDKLSFKFSWYPFSVQLTQRVAWKIVNPGIFATKNFGKRFPLIPSGSKYPSGYYWWSPGIRFHLSLSSAVTIGLSKKNSKKLLLYFETNTNERYLTTYFSGSNTKEMSFLELWQLGCGAKLLF